MKLKPIDNASELVHLHILVTFFQTSVVIALFFSKKWHLWTCVARNSKSITATVMKLNKPIDQHVNLCTCLLSVNIFLHCVKPHFKTTLILQPPCFCRQLSKDPIILLYISGYKSQLHCRSVISRSVSWPWIPNFPHAELFLFISLIWSKKKKTGIQCVPVLVFHTYLGATSLIWCGFRQTINPIVALDKQLIQLRPFNRREEVQIVNSN